MGVLSFEFEKAKEKSLTCLCKWWEKVPFIKYAHDTMTSPPVEPFHLISGWAFYQCPDGDCFKIMCQSHVAFFSACLQLIFEDIKATLAECRLITTEAIGQGPLNVSRKNCFLKVVHQGFSTWGTRTPGGTWDLFRGYENIIAEFASFCWKR